ncbi:MAG: dTMP kinase [Pyrinomonadaceae bacterium]
MSGTFITFEGIDGSGKTTQLRQLAAELHARGQDVLTTREPGGTSLGVRLRAALLDVDEQVDPLAELLLYAADRAQHVRALVRPALAAGRIVLSDRYADATVAYQGAGRGFPSQLIKDVIRLATDGLTPDLTLVFDLPVQTGIARTRRRADAARTGDRLDAEDAAFHERVRNAYLHLAATEPERVYIVDASGSIDETYTYARNIVMPFLEKRGVIK